MTPPPHPHDDLLLRWLAGDPTVDPNPLLRSDPAARARLVVLARLHGQLHDLGRRIADGDVDRARLLSWPRAEVPKPPAVRHHWPRAPLALAAATLVAGLAVLSLSILTIRTRPLVPNLSAVAGVVHLERDGHLLLATTGTLLHPGDQLQMLGTATIELHGGTIEVAPGSSILCEEVDGPRRRLTLVVGSALWRGQGAPVVLGIAGRSLRLTDGTVRVTVGPDLRIQVIAGSAVLEGPGGPQLLPVHSDVRLGGV